LLVDFSYTLLLGISTAKGCWSALQLPCSTHIL